jgi:hypothetical protein
LRKGRGLRRIAYFWATETDIPKRHSRIVLHLPARILNRAGAMTLVLRFAAVDAANHHRVLARTVRWTGG